MRIVQPERTVSLVRLSSGLAVLACFALILILVIESRTPGNDNATIRLDESQKMADCRSAAMRDIKPERTDVSTLYQISDLCYTEIRREYLLGNFNVHRYNVIKQNFQTLVVMWMVVTITMSGVFLAGMQLLAAYKLASSGQGQLADSNDLSLERGKISLKSSVTGLLILTVSLAFFIVYVKWVYTLTPDQSAGEANSPFAPSSAMTNQTPTAKSLGTGHFLSPASAPVAGSTSNLGAASNTLPASAPVKGMKRVK